MKRQYFRKPHRIKRKKSILKNRFFWFGILILMMAGGLVYFLIFSPYFEVKEIKISGNEKTDKEEILNLIQDQILKDFKFFKIRNINLVALGEINKALLENFPQLSKVNSKKNLPDILEIEVLERKVAAIFKQNENYFLADKEGVIFEKINEPSQQIAIANRMLDISGAPPAIIQNSLLNKELKLGEMIAEKETISQILELESKIREELKIPLKELTIVSEDRLNVKTLEGWESYFDLKGDLNWQFVKLKAVLEKKIPPEKRGNINYIDLRFDRVYIFPETYDKS